MLGKSLKELTHQFAPKAQRKARGGAGGLVQGQSGLFIPPAKSIKTLSPDQIAALIQNEAKIIEALAEIEIEQNINQEFNAPPIVDVIETECWANAEKIKARRGDWDFSALRRPRLADHQKRILSHIFQFNAKTERFKYLTVGYSAPKKSGKTTISGWVGYYFAKYVFPPNRVVLVANDRDQAHGLAFAAMKPSLYQAGAHIVDSKYRAELPNGSLIESITTDAESESGGHYILTLWTELWAYHLKNKIALWAEVSPIATERGSMRWFDSYMGYEDKSPLLLDMFLEIFLDTTESVLHPKARPVAELEDIRTTDAFGNSIPCCYERPDIDLFFYIDHENRMEWQKDEKFFLSAGVGMSKVDQVRLYQNRWQKSENKLITSEHLRESFERGSDLPHPRRKMVLAVDAAFGQNNAKLAIVGGFDDTRGEQAIFRTNHYKAWGDGKTELDLKETVGREILELYNSGLILPREPDPKEKVWIEEGCRAIEVHVDPWEFRQLVIDFRKTHKLLLKLFDQKSERLLADTFLEKAYQGGTIDNAQLSKGKLQDDELFIHLDGAAAQGQSEKKTKSVKSVKSQAQSEKEDSEDKSIRIVRGGITPNDLAVAQSMMVWRLQARPPTKRTFGSLAVGKVKQKI